MAVSLDRYHLAGLPPLLHSLWQHTTQLTKVYIVAVDMSSDAVLSYLTCHNLPSHQVCIVWYAIYPPLRVLL